MKARSLMVCLAPLPMACILFCLETRAAQADPSSLRVEGGITAVYQQEVNGSLQDTEASADLFAYLPNSHGEWMLYIEGSSKTTSDSLFNLYPEVNADAGTAQDSRGGSRLQVSELNYRWDHAPGRHLSLGAIDPSAHLDRSRIANDENAHFLGTSFVNNPTIAFPDYALGAMYRIDRTADTPEVTAILSGSKGLADNPGRSYQELIDIAEAGKGVFAGLGARWALGDTRLGVGGWYRSDQHPVLDNTQQTKDNYGVYALYGWQSGNNGVSLRAGAANPSVSAAAYFLGAAYEGITRLGAIGVGVGKIYRSDKLDDVNTGDTLQAESFLRIPFAGDKAHVTLSLQYIQNPGFDASHTVIDSNALIAGVRLHYWFAQ